MPIREITRRTGLSRNTVRKYLASGVVEPRYPNRKSPSRLDDYELTLTSWLFRESRRHRKQRKTVRQLHSDLVQLGYAGSYDRVAAFARDWRHCLSVVQRKPGALRNGVPFTELPDSFRQLQALLLKRPGGDREMVDVLALVLLHDEALVEQAVTEALKIERHSRQHVINCLSRLGEAPRPEPLRTPPALLIWISDRRDLCRTYH